ncbi:protein LURP-one-related 8-like [Phalaenopsis equestris]|uniref:protein LURP-one-related 8-like n=1 Tax=Phalaenopsis equestris TaxID=78828 RepID=UPI0009E588EA|nr:protein LURP-one-related 8-like [Phalaenopsis equestris]
MTNRIYPKSHAFESTKYAISTTADIQCPPPSPPPPATLTVWRKSLLFNCKGFTVFDAEGNLVFRVDKYDRSDKGEIVLMDAAGNPLLTIRRKKLSLGKHWEIYDGEESVNPRFLVRKHVNFLQLKSMAHVTSSDGGLVYEIEGSYTQRSCAVYDERRIAVAEIRRKEEVSGVDFGLDVFRLIVQPGFDAAVAMAFVVLLEEMFGSRSLAISTR